MINGVIYGLFALFVVWGFLLGLKRGLIKSVIRIISVVIACFIVVFAVPPITKAIINMDISSSGLELGGIAVTTVGGTIINAISQISIISELLNASPTIKAVISAVPAIIVNLLLFVVFFYLVKALLYFINIIINKIVLRNQDKEAKKYRLAGAFVGALQSIIVFLFVFIPIAGTMNMVTDALSLVESESDSNQQPIVIQNAAMVEIEDSGDTITTEEMINIASGTVEDYNKNIVIKVFNFIGYKPITNKVYDKLTTIEIDSETETTIREEVMVGVKLYNGFEKLQGLKVAAMTDADEEIINQFIDDAFSSPIIGNVLTELTTEVAKKWTAANPSEFLSIAKPTLSEDLVSTFDNLLIQLRTDTKADLQNDIKVIVKVLKVCADYEVVEIINSGTTDDIVYAVGQDGFIEELIGTMADGKVTKNIIPSIVDLGFDYAYSSLEIDASNIHITKNASEINWDTEKVVLGNIFENVSKTYASTKQEGAILDKIDLVSFADTLDNIRRSQLLAGVGQDISVKLLQCKLLDGVNVDTFVANLQNDITYQDMDFYAMFTSLKSSANIAKDIKDITSGSGNVTNLDTNDVGNLLDGLTAGGATSSVLEDLASEENLTKSGVDNATAGAVSGLVDAIIAYDTTIQGAEQVPESQEELQNATGAVEELLSASKNAKDGNKEYVFSNEEVSAKAKMQDFIKNMISSPFIYKATITKGENFGFKMGNVTKLSSNEVVWMKDVLNALEGLTTINETQKIEIASMFAITL